MLLLLLLLLLLFNCTVATVDCTTVTMAPAIANLFTMLASNKDLKVSFEENQSGDE